MVTIKLYVLDCHSTPEPLTLRELFYKLEKGEVLAHQNVFSIQSAMWCKVAELPEIQELGNYLDLEQLDDLPPPPPGSLPQTFFNQSDKSRALEDEALLYKELLLKFPVQEVEDSDKSLLEEKIQRLENQLKLKSEEVRQSITSSTDIETLRDQYDKKIADSHAINEQDLITIQRLEKEVERYREMEDEFAKLKQKEQFIIERLKKELKREESQRTVITQLKEGFHKLQKENTYVREKYLELQSTYKELKARYKAQLLATPSASLTSEEINLEVEKEQPTNLALEVKAHSQSQETKQALQKEMQQYLKHDAALNEEELLRLTGELFEIDPSSHWYYKHGNEVQGPYCFEEMLDLHEQGQLEGKTMIKGPSGKWNALDNTYEFSTPYQFSVHQIDEKIIKKYYLKRESIRAPFYELVSFMIESQEVRGFCTSLSIGGCFIELGRQEMKSIELGKTVHIEIHSKILQGPIITKAKIVNSSSNRPRGIGMQFIDLSEQTQEIIDEYVAHCLEAQASLKPAA